MGCGSQVVFAAVPTLASYDHENKIIAIKRLLCHMSRRVGKFCVFALEQLLERTCVQWNLGSGCGST